MMPGSPSDFFWSDILAKSDFFGSMIDARFFWVIKKPERFFWVAKKELRLLGMLKKAVIFLGRQVL